MTIQTPETHPGHHTIGRYFKGQGILWYCDSYDTRLGYWMTPVFGERDPKIYGATERINVSERAIDASIHTIHRHDFSDSTFYSCQHPLTPEQREFISTLI